MSDIEWGAPIAVDGARPAWLGGYCKRIAYKRSNDTEWFGPEDDMPDMWSESDITENPPGWSNVEAIRLPATHPAYLAIAKGFEPWAGGDSAPEDWDKGGVILRDGRIGIGEVWRHLNASHDIIGYKKRQPEAVSDDAVMVKRMTEDEAREHWMQADASEGPELPHARGFIDACRYFGLIREPTQAETIAQKTGLTVDQVKSVLNEAYHGTR